MQTPHKRWKTIIYINISILIYYCRNTETISILNISYYPLKATIVHPQMCSVSSRRNALRVISMNIAWLLSNGLECQNPERTVSEFKILAFTTTLAVVLTHGCSLFADLRTTVGTHQFISPLDLFFHILDGKPSDVFTFWMWCDQSWREKLQKTFKKYIQHKSETHLRGILWKINLICITALNYCWRTIFIRQWDHLWGEEPLHITTAWTNKNTKIHVNCSLFCWCGKDCK